MKERDESNGRQSYCCCCCWKDTGGGEEIVNIPSRLNRLYLFHSIQIHRIKSFKFIQTKLATSSLLLSILFLFFSSSANSAKLKSLPTNNLLALIQLPFFIRISRISKLKFEFMGSQQGISSSRQLLRTSPTSHPMFQSSNPSKSLTDPLLFLASDVGSTVN